MDGQVSVGQVIGLVLASNGLLVGVIVYLAQKFGPRLFDWMRAKIDTKNGEISQLVEEVKRLSQAICVQVRQANQQQDEFVSDMREICANKDEQIASLIEQIKAALERAA